MGKRDWLSFRVMRRPFLQNLSRGIRRRRYSFTLQPSSDLSPADGAWVATGTSPQFDLCPLHGQYPVGWVLFDTRLVRRSADCSARLILNLGKGFDDGMVIDVPSTRKGRVHELLCLPPGVTGIRWAPQVATGEIQHGPVCFTEIGTPERIYRMVRRIVPVLWRRPRERLLAAGLSITRMLTDLTGAYQAAGKLRAYAPAPSYSRWIERFDTLSPQDQALITRHIGRFRTPPRFLLVVTVITRRFHLIPETLQSIARQLYRDITVVLLHPDGAREALSESQAFLSRSGLNCRIVADQSGESCLQELHQLLEGESAEYVALLHGGDVLTEHALYWMASMIESCPDIGLLYSDEDRVNVKDERHDPIFKPDWTPEFLRSTNYVGQFAVYRREALMQAGGLTLHDCLGDSHDLLLRVTDVLPANRIVHIPAILFHRRAVSQDTQLGSEIGACQPSGIEAVEAHLRRKGIRATVAETFSGTYRIRYSLPDVLPMISLVIPTRDSFHLLRRCLDSLEKSTYPHYEILVVDNQSIDEPTLKLLENIRSRPNVRVLSYDRPFNYSAMNNHAAEHAKGDVLCLLNNDTEVISPDWMEEMLGHLIQDRVGVVGAKLYYSDDRVQHAGDVVGVGGVANHLHAFLDRDSPGYCRRAVLAQDLSAVTGACLMTWRSLYLKLGGLNEEHLPVAFNDVDYCLRVREAGYRVVWTPQAELYHHESVSRGAEDTPEKMARAKKEVAYMGRRWRHVIQHDPFYNPNLSYERPDFSLSHAPVIPKPWLAQP